MAYVTFCALSGGKGVPWVLQGVVEILILTLAWTSDAQKLQKAKK